MNTGKMLYSRPDGSRIEMVYVDDGKQTVHVMEWPDALLFATNILNQVTEVAKFGVLSRYIEIHNPVDNDPVCGSTKS